MIKVKPTVGKYDFQIGLGVSLLSVFGAHYLVFDFFMFYLEFEIKY